jgi:hypothetical protein
MRQLKPWPIVVGILVDTFASLALVFAYVLLVFGVQLARGDALSDPVPGTVEVLVLESLGILVTALGGFVAGWMAKTLETLHGLAVGIGAVIIWWLFDLVEPTEGPLAWWEVASSFAVVPLGALGGYLAKWVTARAA